MKNAVRLVCALSACASLAGDARAQTALAPGDVAFSGYGSTGTDQFSFALLRDVAAGTSISFTDRGWLAAGGFRSGEGAFELTFGADYPCGAEFVAVMSPLEVWDPDGVLAGTTTGGGLQLSTSGDQVFAYQGGPPTASDESGLLAGLQMNGGWDADAVNTNTSTRPSSLVEGVHAVALAPEVNNARYDCGISGGEPGLLAAAFHDDAGWLVDDPIPFDLFTTCGVSCTGACVQPEAPTIAGNTLVMEGESTTLAVETGELGDATDWQWYEGGCGATPVGSGSSLTIAPITTTDLFVRGEGGCVTPDVCTAVTVTVEPLPPLPQTKGQQKCLNIMLTQLGVVSKLQSGEVAKCVKNQAKGKEPSAEACVSDDAGGKMGKAETKVGDLQAKKCGEAPDFGFVSASAVAGAARTQAQGSITDLLGVAFDGAILPGEERAGSKCQLAILGSAKKCLDARLKEYGKCVKAGLKDGSITSAAGLAACIGVDPKGKIAVACDLGGRDASKADGLRKSLAKLCIGAEIVPSAVLPECPGASDVESAHDCISPRLACRACRAAEETAALGADCDLLDDGTANGSCAA